MSVFIDLEVGVNFSLVVIWELVQFFDLLNPSDIFLKDSKIILFLSVIQLIRYIGGKTLLITVDIQLIAGKG